MALLSACHKLATVPSTCTLSASAQQPLSVGSAMTFVLPRKTQSSGKLMLTSTAKWQK